MADFFTRLAARTIGVASTLQPRIASLYEPPQAGGMSEAEEFPQAHYTDRHDPGRSLSFSLLESGEQASKEMNPALSAHREEDAGKAFSAGESALQGEARKTPDGASRPELLSSRDETPTWLPPESDARLSEDRVKRGREDPQMLQDEVGEGDSQALSHAKASWDNPREALVGRDERTSPSALPLLAPTLPWQRTDARSVVGKVSQGGEDPQTFQERESSVPVVQVTIGRIEVRATPAPTARSQSSRSGSPVMGLEEYLKQRGGGDR